MSLSESQFAAFKAINQQAQRLLHTPQTREVREVMEQIIAISRVQTNKIIDANKVAAPPDDTPVSPMIRMQKAMSRGPSKRVSNIIWAVVAALWIAVGYLGSQHFHEIFQQPAEAAEVAGGADNTAPAVEAATTANAATNRQ